MKPQELIPHLFRKEFTKIASVLCRHFGIDHIEVAEDIASDTFLAALEIWPYKGIPENPVAWLYMVAKNKTKNYLHRNEILAQKIILLNNSQDENVIPEIDLSSQNISDSQLQMLFAVCNPVLSVESQIGLALRILCGFGIEEIANALLSNKETINKRLYRAKETLRSEKIKIEFPPESEIPKRLSTALATIYLLFNEGYYSESQDELLLEDLCHEAIRLTQLLTENEKTNLPEVNALLALMYFHSSRFPARKDQNGEIVLYEMQDESLWDQKLIATGIYHLKLASQGNRLSKYHIEASIAFWHTVKTDSLEKWENILLLYNHLLVIEYSPIAALNRTFAFSKVRGKQAAIFEAEKLQLKTNRFYFTLLGELYKEIDAEKAIFNFESALSLAKTESDKRIITGYIAELRR